MATRIFTLTGLQYLFVEMCHLVTKIDPRTEDGILLREVTKTMAMCLDLWPELSESDKYQAERMLFVGYVACVGFLKKAGMSKEQLAQSGVRDAPMVKQALSFMGVDPTDAQTNVMQNFRNAFGTYYTAESLAIPPAPWQHPELLKFQLAMAADAEAKLTEQLDPDAVMDKAMNSFESIIKEDKATRQAEIDKFINTRDRGEA
jgi:hypothetical protein